MKILSLFDGMSCGMIAMKNANIDIEEYIAYEIDKYAIKTSLHNFPNIKQCGDVFLADFSQYKNFDWIIGGSPCTHWSIAQTKNRETTASGIGWELFSQYVRAIKEVQPKYFIYENNKSMSKEIRKAISDTLGFEPICINSALVSAQSRNRLYWVGKRNKDGSYSKVKVEQPLDKGILVKDILDSGYDLTHNDKTFTLTASYNGAVAWNTIERSQRNMIAEPVGMTVDKKSYCLTSGYANGSGEKIGNYVAHTLTKGCKTMVAEPVNITKDGKSQKIKHQYRQTSIANICCYNSTYGATGVAESVQVGALPRPNGELSKSQGFRIYSINGKSVTLKGNSGGAGGKTGLYAIPLEFNGDIPIRAKSQVDGKEYIVYDVKNGLITIKEKEYPIKLNDGYYIIRKLTVNECKRLQTVPDWYEFPVSDAQAYKMLGNGWTIDVITHLIKSVLNDI